MQDTKMQEARPSLAIHQEGGQPPAETEDESTLSSSGNSAQINEAGLNERVRSYSLQIVRTSSYVDQTTNPFFTSDPALDPHRPAQFNAKKWAKALLQHSNHQPDLYPRHAVGLSFQRLDVHGFGTPTDYQNDVLNVLLKVPTIAMHWLSRKSLNSEIKIIRDAEGLVKKGEMLLVLGRPGSGVSTLLKTLSGETKGLHLGPDAKLDYDGISAETMNRQFKGEAIYQAETEVHFPHLTVGQTLLFAALARTPNNRLPGVSRQLYARHFRDVVMAVLGISHTVNTKVGDSFVRGVSGGEQKRVSIAEVMLSGSPIQCWDNSTRGLDSATALQFIRTLRLSTDLAQTSAVAAMYQGSEPAYELFDKVTLLYQGRQIYFGPTNKAKQYFVDLGYFCPERQTTADFLTSLTNPAERIIAQGFEDKVPRSPDEFAAVWKKSHMRAQLMGDIRDHLEQFPTGGEEEARFAATRKLQQSDLLSNRSPYTISVPQQVWLCITRGYQRILGDKLFFFVTVAGNFVISLVLGSVFFDLPKDASSINSRCIVLFFAILFNGLSSTLEILTLYAQRHIVEKHARYALYHPMSEAIASTICDLPSKIFSTLAFNVPIYFMVGLRSGADHFFIFLLFGFTCTLSMSMILRTIAQTSRSIHQALTPAAILILALVIYTGFVLPTREMQGWLRWINYLNPIAYAYESLVANELGARRLDCLQFVPAYPDLDSNQRACAVPGAAPGADFIDGTFYIDANYGYRKSHIWRNFGILISFIIVFFTLYLLSAEYITTDHSKGEVLVFRRKKQARAEAKTTGDEESGSPGEHRLQDMQSPSRPVVKSRTPRDGDGNIFHWKDVCYDITIKGEPRRILDHVNGWVKPGTLTALMGASGAGKTTLLDVLANRGTMGVVTGDMLVNGTPRQADFQRSTGYVQQQDVHLPTSTIREALRFSAILRQPASTSKQEKYDYVEEVISLLEMDDYADAVVGVPGEGLNVEQRKRLTIGVELVAKPDLLLFLDEPTSGLDSQTAWSIATLIRKLSDNGQAILCTIHQPSAILFQQFDRLLLLAPGGKTVYFGDMGENASTLITYLQGHGATPCGRDENPAEWMLKVVRPAAQGDDDATAKDWSKVWLESQEFAVIQQEVERLQQRTQSSEKTENAAAATSYAAPAYVQLAACTERIFQQYWRTPSYIYSKLVLSGGTSLFIGLSFFDAPLSMMGLQSQMFSLFMLLVVFAFLVYQTMPNFIIQREQYEARERASQAYSWYVFMLSNITVELPWNTLVAVIIFFTFYYLVGMHQNATSTDTTVERGGLMFLLTWTFMMFESTFAHMVVAGAPTAEIGATLALLLFTFCLIFCGVVVPEGSLPGFWKFMYRVSPLTYLIDGMLSTGLARNEVECSDLEVLRFEVPQGGNFTCGSYMDEFTQMAGGSVYNANSTDMCQYCPLASTDDFLATISISYSNRWRNFGLMWVYIIFNLFAALGLYWLCRVPKGRRMGKA